MTTLNSNHDDVFSLPKPQPTGDKKRKRNVRKKHSEILSSTPMREELVLKKLTKLEERKKESPGSKGEYHQNQKQVLKNQNKKQAKTKQKKRTKKKDSDSEDEEIVIPFSDDEVRGLQNQIINRREHTGTLVLKAENDSGRDEASIKIKVLDKPSKPEGPLKISDVHKEGCTLKWNPPQDDGGVLIEYYAVEKLAGRSKEPKIELNNLEPGQEYKFRVSAVNAEGESEPLEAEQTIVAKNPFDEPGAPGTPEVTDWDKDRVDLRWAPSENDGGSPITGYIIKKRGKGSPKWAEAGETGPYETKGTADNLDEGTEYEFTVRAVNAAGPGEPSQASKSVITKPRRLAPKVDRRNLFDLTVREGEPIYIDVKVSGEPAPDMTWYQDVETITGTAHKRIDDIPYNSKLEITVICEYTPFILQKIQIVSGVQNTRKQYCLLRWKNLD
ncbi:hypothetical protein JTB14_004195 [Gonioctena quinquepunctata]|nr:hypothetical protein JTB14_004195 [Gonioctena quinquepunctata]